MTAFQWAMLVCAILGGMSTVVTNIVLAVKGGIVVGELTATLKAVTETLKDHGARLLNLEQK